MNLLTGLNLSRKRLLPVVLSAEAAECGLAAMVMVGSYYGHDIDLNGLRQRYSLSITGATLRNIMALADQLGFGTRALKVELDALRHVPTPAVLHWDLNHFVVLKSASTKAVVIHDPARGARTLTWEEASKHFTGVVLEIIPAASFQKLEVREPVHLNSLWSKAVGLKSAAVQVLALSAALQITAFAAPFQIQLVVDDAIGRSDSALLTALTLGFAALLVLQAMLDALRAWSLQVFGNLLTFQVVANLVRHLLRLPAEFFEKRHIGDILSRIGSTTAVQDALTKGIVSALIDGTMALAAAAILFAYSTSLALIVLAAVALNFIVAAAFYPMLRARTEEQLIVSASERSYLMETVRAASTIKLMGREAERESSWRNLYANVVNATVSLGKFQIGANSIQTSISGLSTLLIIYLGAQSIISGKGFSVGMLLAFVSFRQTFSDRTNALINQAIQFRLLGLHLGRLSDIVTATPEVPTGASPHITALGAISLRSVSFRYGLADPFVLKDINLEIHPKEFVAITGPSGGGKTTLLKLLLGMRIPTEGSILLDGRPATPELWRAWRSNVGVVSQDDSLLSGTIASNIGFFDPDLNMDRVHKAAEQALIHADISRMPMQYLSLIGDMGSSLSGGQRQRVLLARALYRNPQILVLDEGTANLDEETENVIADFVASLSITRIVVAHRPALVARADRTFTV